MIDLEVGTVYKVVMDDCCVTGSFISKLKAKTNEGEYSELWFDNGVYLGNSWACKFEELVFGCNNGV